MKEDNNSDNRLKRYEMTLLVKPETSQDEMGWLDMRIKAKGATILEKSDDGIKGLAYPIKGFEKAHYLFYMLAMPVDNPDDYFNSQPVFKRINEFCEHIEKTGCLLRYLLITADERKR